MRLPGRKRWIGGLSAVALLGLLPALAPAQSTLQQIFQEAAAAVKAGTVGQQFTEELEDSAEETNPRADSNSRRRDSSADAPGGESLPAPQFEGKLPLAGDASGEVQLSTTRDGRITLVVRDASLSRVLALIAQTQHLNIVAANDIDALISITLRDVPLEEALTAILSVANYTWVKRNDIILITSLTDAVNLPADVQGRQIEVFDLDFASATVVAEAVTTFLSPIGSVAVSRSDPADNRLTQEQVIVEDLPMSLARIADFICQMDQPPRQVLIEAHVLQVNLTDETRCGVNFNELLRISNSRLTLSTTGFANENAPQAFLATLQGGDLSGVIEALQSTTDAKTLGSPKLLVLNGQEAQIQVGETIYYTQTTTTETSSQQGAASVETGVILRISPRITHDGRVLLRVEPQVSSPTGERPSENLPPNIANIELRSDVMLRDGEGMIIGGLIDERDVTSQQKVPYLGNTKGIGWLFRRTLVTKERSEIVFALVPRIQPYDAEWQAYEQGELVKAGVPLFYGPLCRTDRPWDAILPDGKRVAQPLDPRKRRPLCNGRYYQGLGSQYTVPPYPLPQQQFYGEACDVPAPAWIEQPSDELPVPEEVLPIPDFHGPRMEEVDIFSDLAE